MLYLVPTPLGNLGDMPPRAVEVLRGASEVYCEDTRRTRVLFTHFGIESPLLRYNDKDPRSEDRLLEKVRSGAPVALVSDSGLPCVSDPGARVVQRARREGLAVTALPGPSALTAAVAGSGFPADSFVFLGFLPRRPGPRRRAIEEAARLGKTMIVYESPYRVVRLLDEAATVLGRSAPGAAVRELSKIHEEWFWGTLGELSRSLGARESLLGEFVVLMRPPLRGGIEEGDGKED
jgi:16S rRNA (cytidine1402-2'-O)-methyltransferase